jgi:hypothetical protein
VLLQARALRRSWSAAACACAPTCHTL